MPADVPHLRPAGSVPQFLVTVGAGFGMPTPEMGLPAAITVATGAAAGAAGAGAWPHPVSSVAAQVQRVASAANEERVDDMAAPYELGC